MGKPSQAEIDAEATAADYIGVARARELAKQGYFRDQVKRAAATVRAPQKPVFEVRSLGGAVLGRGESAMEAKRLAESAMPPDYALELWQAIAGQWVKLAVRMRWDAVHKRRCWETVA